VVPVERRLDLRKERPYWRDEEVGGWWQWAARGKGGDRLGEEEEKGRGKWIQRRRGREEKEGSGRAKVVLGIF
jgi:hypothetical protein